MSPDPHHLLRRLVMAVDNEERTRTAKAGAYQAYGKGYGRRATLGEATAAHSAARDRLDEVMAEARRSFLPA